MPAGSGGVDVERALDFDKVTRLIVGLRACTAVWLALEHCEGLFWLTFYYEHATARGGVLQQRRIAAYLAMIQLPHAMVWIYSALGVSSTDHDQPSFRLIEDLLSLASACERAGFGVKPHLGGRRVFASDRQGPTLSPTRSVQIPMVVFRDGSYRPSVIVLNVASDCVACRKPMPQGAKALWAKGGRRLPRDVPVADGGSAPGAARMAGGRQSCRHRAGNLGRIDLRLAGATARTGGGRHIR